MPPAVRPNSVNYAGGLFFTLLIVGFTFQLPTLLYIPMIFFAVAAGIIFFKDALSGRSIGAKAGADDAFAKPQKGSRRFIVRLLFWAFAVAGLCAVLYIGFIIVILIMLSSSGGFG